MIKLTKGEVVEIKISIENRKRHLQQAKFLNDLSLSHRALAKFVTHQALARRFGVSKSAIQKIADGENHAND